MEKYEFVNCVKLSAERRIERNRIKYKNGFAKMNRMENIYE